MYLCIINFIQRYEDMLTEVNTTEKVKILLSFDTIERIKRALPSSSIARMGRELGVHAQAVSNELNKVVIAHMSEDRQSRLIDKTIICKAIEILQETGNHSFDHLIQ